MPNIGDKKTKKIDIPVSKIAKELGIASSAIGSIGAMLTAARTIIVKIISGAAVSSGGNPFVFVGITLVGIASAVCSTILEKKLGANAIIRVTLYLKYTTVTRKKSGREYKFKEWQAYDFKISVI